MDALHRWREELLARTIPPEIVAAAPESPWRYPPALFRSRADRAVLGPPTPTTVHALEVLPAGGTVLDVGCGGGATSLPLAEVARRVIGVDQADDMLEAFRSALEMRTSVETVRGGWPESAAKVPHADVVVCGHVLYNVQDLAPFARALDGAGERVLVELTDHHPLRWMNDLWRRFHGLEFPEGPTAELAQQALDELGFEVHRDRRDASRGHGGFPTREEAVAIVRRRLCLPADRDGEIAEALGDRLREDDGHWSAGPPAQDVYTLWWDPRR